MARIANASLGSLNQAVAITTDLARTYTGTAAPGSTVGWDLSGIYVGTVIFEGTIDDTNWFPLAAFPQLANGLLGAFVNQTAGVGTGSAGTGRWMVHCLGYSQVRVRLSAYTSGSVAVAGDITSDTIGMLPVLRELMITNELLAQGFNLNVDLQNEYRNDPNFPSSQQGV